MNIRVIVKLHGSYMMHIIGKTFKQFDILSTSYIMELYKDF